MLSLLRRHWGPWPEGYPGPHWQRAHWFTGYPEESAWYRSKGQAGATWPLNIPTSVPVPHHPPVLQCQHLPILGPPPPGPMLNTAARGCVARDMGPPGHTRHCKSCTEQLRTLPGGISPARHMCLQLTPELVSLPVTTLSQPCPWLWHLYHLPLHKIPFSPAEETLPSSGTGAPTPLPCALHRDTLPTQGPPIPTPCPGTPSPLPPPHTGLPSHPSPPLGTLFTLRRDPLPTSPHRDPFPPAPLHRDPLPTHSLTHRPHISPCPKWGSLPTRRT